MVNERPLTALEREILEFERQPWKSTARRADAVRERFGLSLPAHLQRLHLLLDRPEALAYDPTNVRRLLRLRHMRAVARGARRPDWSGA